MIKKKWFSVVSTGILAFSSGAPSVLAGAPFVLDLIQDENKMEFNLDSSVSLAEVVEVTDENVQAFLADIYISKDADGNLVLVGGSNTYALNISINEESVSIDENEEFNVVLTLNQEIQGEKLSIEILSAGEVVEEISIPVEELVLLADLSDTYNEDVSSLEKEEIPEEVLEETTDSEESVEEADLIEEIEEVEELETVLEESEETVSEEVEYEEETITEDVVEESAETDTEKESVEENEEEEAEVESEEGSESEEEPVAFERSSEVESLLHGEEEVAPTFQTFNFMTFSSTTRTHSDGLYTVRAGDTFGAIATSFNLSQAQLREWNGHVSNINSLSVGTQLAVTRRGVERLLSPADQARLYKGGATPVFTTNQGFINEIAPRAIAIANQSGEEGLYASLMIAQAAHESAYGRSSLASPPYHNLSGIKGTHNGNSTLMWTWEVYNGVRVDVLAGFRHYPSYDASLQDYANLLRRGLSWDRRYYAGTWRSTTTSVFDVLDRGGLRGYATDPNYFAAIRRIINQFNLTQYDNIQVEDLTPKLVENISNSRTVNYSGILRTGYSIDTMPWGMNGFQRLGRTEVHADQLVNVVREAQNGAYLLIELNGELLGWVDHRAVNTNARRISNGIDISYDVIVQNGGYSLDSQPWGTNGFVRLSNTTQYRGQEARVVQETKNGNYVLLQQNGQLIGWADHRSVRRAIEVQNVSNSFPVDYTATIARSGYSMDSLPWGTAGFQRVDRTNNRVGTRVQVTHETGSYALVTVNGTRLGWVDKAALDGVPVRQNYSAASTVNYTATLRSGYTLDTLPWGVAGHRRISRTQFYSGQTVRVTSQTGSYALIQINGRNFGWVDRRAIIR